jgi:hypothetical protein
MSQICSSAEKTVAPHKSSSHPVRQSRLTPAANQTHPLLNLQRKIGNQALMRLLEFRIIPMQPHHVGLQPKLAVSEPEDVHEQEADRVPTGNADAGTATQRACECEGAGDCASVQSDQKQSSGACAGAATARGFKYRRRSRSACEREPDVNFSGTAARSVRLAPSWSPVLDRIFSHVRCCTRTRLRRDRPMT